MATKRNAKVQQRLCTTHNMPRLLAVASVSNIDGIGPVREIERAMEMKEAS